MNLLIRATLQLMMCSALTITGRLIIPTALLEYRSPSIRLDPMIPLVCITPSQALSAFHLTLACPPQLPQSGQPATLPTVTFLFANAMLQVTVAVPILNLSNTLNRLPITEILVLICTKVSIRNSVIF